MPRIRSSPRWLTMAVLLPLVVLGVLAWMGVKAQVRAAWSLAREEAKTAGSNAEAVLASDLKEAVVTTRLFADPPVPGVASGADELLDGDDLTVLRNLRDDPQAGLSPAGLPRRVLAGFRVFEASRDSEDARILIELATGDGASVLTPLVLAKLEVPAADWSRGDKARALFKRNPDVGVRGRWVGDPESMWLARDGEGLRFVDHPSLIKAMQSAHRVLPAWADLVLSLDGRKTAGTRVDCEVMESLPVDFGEDLRLEIVAARPELIEAAARRQGTWALGLLGCAVLVSGGALGMMHHAIRRERLLSDMKSQFVASVSHELRAPVASIRLMADALEAEKVDVKTAKEFHRLIAMEGARLSTLVGNVLDHARIEQGRKVWKMEPCDISALAADTLRVMEPLAGEKGIALKSELAPMEATVDAGAIQQALVNLLDNAIKFSPSGTTVEVRLSQADGILSLSVRDEGPGIPKHEHGRVFERFYRPGDELRRETQGTGIGLSLVKSIAEAHRGSVGLRSEAGTGSEFTLKIPIQA